MAQKLKFGNGTWATKKGSTLAYNDENNNYKPLPFSFTRDSIATRVNKEGLIEVVGNNKPRIDYKDSSEGVLLLEPSRANAYLHSDYLYNFSGDKTFNHATSPEGVKNATLLTKTSASDQFLNIAWTGTTISASSDYTMSIFVKHNGDDVNVKYEYNNSNDWGGVPWLALFEVRASGVTKSTVGNCTSNVEDFGNGWYRLKVFVTSGASITASSPANLFRVIGASAETILVYGAQMEKGSYASSYIPTSGSSVQRAADTATGAGNSEVFNDSEGVLFIQSATLVELLTQNHIISIHDGTTNNRVNIYWREDVPSELIFSVFDGGVEIYTYTTTSIALDDMNKVSLRYGSNNFSAWANGFKLDEQTSGGSVNLGLNTLDFNWALGSASEAFYGKTKEIGYYDTILTDEELEYMTSYRSLNELVTELNLNEL